MRSLRLAAALALGLTPLLGSLAAGTVPASAGGGAGMTLTATMEGQDQRLLVGTKHLVTITVADTPGESDLRDIWVGLDDLDPHPLAVTCPAGVNGQLALEPEQSLRCTAVVTAEVGYRTLVARARARVPGGGSLVRSAPLHYTGFLPPPPPPPKPVVHPALKTPVTPEPAAARPHPGLLAPAPVPVPVPVNVPADPPGGAEKTDTANPANPTDPAPVRADPADPADPPATACPGGKTGSANNTGSCCGSKVSGATGGCCPGGKASSNAGSGCCDAQGSGSGSGSRSGSSCTKAALAPGSGHKGDLLAFTGMTTAMLATVGGVGAALLAVGALLVRRSSQR